MPAEENKKSEEAAATEAATQEEAGAAEAAAAEAAEAKAAEAAELEKARAAWIKKSMHPTVLKEAGGDTKHQWLECAGSKKYTFQLSSTVSWGFALKCLPNSLLMIVNVHPSSVADEAGMFGGDYLENVGGDDLRSGGLRGAMESIAKHKGNNDLKQGVFAVMFLFSSFPFFPSFFFPFFFFSPFFSADFSFFLYKTTVV